jgi:protein-tyrosine-phosphatase
VASGADFPLALFQLLVEGRSAVASNVRVGLCARNLRADARWHLVNARADRSDPTLNTRPWPGVVSETLVNVLTGRERTDTFTLDDPRPGLAEAAQLLRDAAKQGRVLAFARARMSRRRRRRLQTATRAELDRAARILFVCKGNICRSPFAAALARGLLRDDQKIDSAGFLEPGRRPPAEAIAAAAGWRVDLREHRSRVVSAEIVADSDAIFVFDHRNYDRMVALFPESEPRLHLLGALDADGPLFVPDPWGRGADVFAATYGRIAEALSAAVTR